VNRTTLAGAALAALALTLAAAPSPARAASPINGSVELRLGSFKPDVDSEFAAGTAPYQKVFGSKRPLKFEALASKALWRGFGTFEAGVGAGFWRASGRGVFASGGSASGDRTVFNVVPTSLALTWRFDLLQDRFNFPIVPFARASLERYNWWVTNGGGTTVKSGATNGYSFGGGLGLALDFLDPTLGRELDTESGVNHVLAVVEVKKAQVDDFGSGTSWNLSDTNAVSLSFGLTFVF
jgi:hypothetical protein